MKKATHPAKRAVPVFLCLCLAVCCLVPAIAAATQRSASAAQMKLCILSDLHYLAASDQAIAAGNDLRLYGESVPAAEEAIEAVIRERPDVLILTGDLTSSGERASAEELAQKLKKVEQAGIRVYVINGDCDVRSGGLSPSEFRNLFWAYGYDGADDAAYYQPPDTDDANAVQGGLSYSVSPKPGVRLLMIDNEAYTGDCSSESGGTISDRLMNWILQQVKKAKQNGETLIAGMHRPLLPHKSGTISEALNGAIDHGTKIAQRFADAGLSYLFTGHMHETDVAKYTSPKGNWLLDMETGSLVTYGAPIRTATVEGTQITLTSESVKEILWKGQRIDYQEHLHQSLFSDTAFSSYAMRFLDSPLETLETNGLKKGIEQIAQTGDLDSAIQKVIQSALQSPLSLDLGGKLQLQLRLDGTDTVIIESSASFLLPALRLSISENLIPMVHDLFSQIDAQWLAKDASGKSPLRREIEQLVSTLCASVLSESADGRPYTVNDFLTDMMLTHNVGQESLDERAAALLEQLNPALTRALITEQILPAAASLCQKILNDLKLDTSFLSANAGALWKPALGLISSTRAGTLAKLAGFSASDTLQKALTEERVRRIGAAVSGLASGFYIDTQGIDDRVDGTGVRYTDGNGVFLSDGYEESESVLSSQPATVQDTQPASHAAQAVPNSKSAPSISREATVSVPSPSTIASLHPDAHKQASDTAAAVFSPATLSAILFMAAAAFAVSDFRRL